MSSNEIDNAAEILAAAKHTERLAIEARIRAEQTLLAIVPTKPEGSITTKTDGWKVTVTGVVNRTIDAAALEIVRDEVSPELFGQAIRYKPEVIAAGVKYLAANEPEVYAILALALIAKPGKSSVVVERIATELEHAA